MNKEMAMEVKCTRNCKQKDSEGKCLAPSITIGESGCSAFINMPEFEPFRTDNVVIYDKAGIPSIMVRFSRTTNDELFGGSEKVHPAFIIDGQVYDEIYINKYPNTVINKKAYSLPMQKPKTGVAFDEAVEACRSKGEGWHLWTAAERGLLANLCKRDGVFPHGNTNRGKWHGDDSEKGEIYGEGKTLAGSGPASWNHDHTPFGVSDLCGNIWEWFAGLRLMNGALQFISDNDAAVVDLSTESGEWKTMLSEGKPICIDATEGILFTNNGGELDGSNGCDYCIWENVRFDFHITEEMKELGLYPGEPRTYLYADTDGERLPLCGGGWSYGAGAGVFYVSLNNPRSDVGWHIGFRSAFYRKLDSEN